MLKAQAIITERIAKTIEITMPDPCLRTTIASFNEGALSRDDLERQVLKVSAEA